MQRPYPLLKYTPIAIFLVFISIKISFYHFYHSLLREDGLIESLTCVFFLLGSAFSFISYKLITDKSIFIKHYSTIFLALGFIFLFISLEEISWGQRIFNFPTPDILKEINVQNETTIHNLDWIHFNITMNAYILIGFSGFLAPSFADSSSQVKNLLIPNKNLTFYFLPILASALYFEYGILIKSFYFIEPIDNEICEMILALGLLIFTYSKLRWLKTEGSKILIS
jgi:hypothetical protein